MLLLSVHLIARHSQTNLRPTPEIRHRLPRDKLAEITYQALRAKLTRFSKQPIVCVDQSHKTQVYAINFSATIMMAFDPVIFLFAERMTVFVRPGRPNKMSASVCVNLRLIKISIPLVKLF